MAKKAISCGGGGPSGKSVKIDASWIDLLAAELAGPTIPPDAVSAADMMARTGAGRWRSERILASKVAAGTYQRARGRQNGRAVWLYWPV